MDNAFQKFFDRFEAVKQRERWDVLKGLWVRARMMDFFEDHMAKAPQAAQSAALFDKQLKAMKARFDALKDKAKKGGGDVPTGPYLCRLSRIEPKMFNMKDDEGKPMSVLGAQATFLVVDGEQAGERIMWWPKFHTDDKMLYFLRDLRKLGVDTDVEEIDGALFQRLTARKPAVRISVEWKTGDNGVEYQNIYLKQGVDLEPANVAAHEEVAIEEPGDSEPEAEEPTPTPAPKASGNKPPKGPAKKAPAAAEPDPEPEAEEPDAEPDPEPDTEPEAPALEAGDEAQFKAKGKVMRGLVKKIEGGKAYIRVGDQTWPVSLDFPSLAKVD